jgi:hypothetical protein
VTFTGEFGAQALSPRELTAAQLNRLVQVRARLRLLCFCARVYASAPSLCR